jgi:hypothetical protein
MNATESRLHDVAKMLPTLERKEVERIVLAYALFVMRLEESANELIVNLPDDTEAKIWGPTL